MSIFDLHVSQVAIELDAEWAPSVFPRTGSWNP